MNHRNKVAVKGEKNIFEQDVLALAASAGDVHFV